MDSITLRANGMTFRTLTGGQGAPVICLHGFPDDLRTYRHQLPALAGAGYRALSPGLRGYEPATQPGDAVAHYHPVRAADDVIEWAKTLGRVHLVGHDWGAIAGYLAAASRPDLFCSLTTLAVPHFSALRERSARRLLPAQLRKSWYVIFFQLRGVSDRVLERNNFAFIERLWRDWSPGFAWEPDAMASVKRTFRQPGVRRAALSYYRAMLAPRSESTRRMDELMTRPIQVPTLAITGARDGCLDTRFFEHVPPRLFPAGLRTERIEGVGHFLHQEAPDDVNGLLLSWLREHA